MQTNFIWKADAQGLAPEILIQFIYSKIQEYACLFNMLRYLHLNFSVGFCLCEYLLRSLKKFGAFLAVQWLRLHLPLQGVQVWYLVGEIRAHMPQGHERET